MSNVALRRRLPSAPTALHSRADAPAPTLPSLPLPALPCSKDKADLAGALLSDGGVEGQGFPDKLAALLREVYPELPQVTVEYRNLCVVRMQAHELTA